MKFFHKHKREIIVKTYVPPSSNLLGLECNDMITVNRMLFGYTSILMQCSICKKLYREEMFGKEEEKQND